VENRPGAGTIIATDLVAKAVPDGHTIGWVITAHAVNPSLYARLPYDTLRDLRGITLAYQLKIVMVTSPNSPLRTVDELIATAKARPGHLTFTSASVGTGGHLLGELLKLKHGLDMQHIGYKGGVAAHPDVMSGRVSVMFDTLPNALPQLKAGRLRAMAVIGDAPDPALPNVPALKGLLPARAVTGWNGLVVPAATPKATVAKLHADFNSAILSAPVQETFASLNVETITATPSQFDAFIREEIERWGEVVNRAGIRLE
jgi:tripartite-type tricarboxylate transporter receptor subunit TctC